MTVTSSALHDALGPAPQSEPAIGREDDMVKNTAGGYVFPVDVWTRLDRFLMLGTDSGTYYTDQRALTLENAKAVREAIKEEPYQTLRRVVQVSEEGRAPKNDQALFALAMVAAYAPPDVKQLALEELPKVARIGTHLFLFVSFLKQMRGFGRSVKRALEDWYLCRSDGSVALQVTKYRQRHGWSHRDVLRVAHPATLRPVKNDMFSWIVNPDKYEVNESTHGHLRNFLTLQTAKTSGEAARMVGGSITHEMIPTHLKNVDVWEALLMQGLPITALIRNLPTLTRHNLLVPMSETEEKARARLTSAEHLAAGRVHPMNVLIAAKTYAAGKSVRGKATWDPNPNIVEALDTAFHMSFGHLPTINKRVYVGLDVSGSMGWDQLMGVPGFTPAIAGAALSVVFARQAAQSVIYGFSTGEGRSPRFGWMPSPAMRQLPIVKNTSLNDAIRLSTGLAFGATDCAMPMLHAMKEGIEADAFVVITDNETWHGKIHPFQALQMYRKKTGIMAKLVVVGMTATGFSIADPSDAGMLDVVGFDAAVPRVVQEFLN